MKTNLYCVMSYMSNRFAGVLLWILLALFIRFLSTGDVRVDYGNSSYTEVWTWVSVAWTLLVSPYGVQDEIIDIISEAKYSVDMRMYLFTSKELLAVIKNLSVLWVDVNMMLENKVYGGSSKERDKVKNFLDPFGVDIVSDEALGTNFVHAKAVVIDEQSYIISTANLSYTSFWKNREYWFVWEDPLIAQSLTHIFEKDYAGDVLFHKDVHPALLVCPLNCRDKIIDAIHEADEEILIQAQYIQDQEVADELIAKQSSWIPVFVMVGEYQDEWWIEWLGTWVRMMDETYLHAKNLLIDGKKLIMWSMNLSSNALDNNREIWIIINDPDITWQFKQQFWRDWEKEE